MRSSRNVCRKVLGVMLLTSLAGASEKPATCDLTIAPLPQNVQLTEKAKLLTAQPDKRVTPLWAQEAIGSPEAMEFLNWFDKENPSRPVVWVPVGINDGGVFLNYLAPEKLNDELRKKLASGVDVAPANPSAESLASRKHAYSVSTLIADPYGTGVGHRAYYSWFSNALTQRDVSSSFTSAQVKPQFVNRSVGVRVPGGVDNSQDIQTIASQTVVVAASGNSFPWVTDKGSYRAIIVGAVDPSGLMADFSQSGSGLTVSAPGHFVLAMVGPGQMDAISGTSFAAPIVTGVLSTVASILPGISFEELKEMLRRTAIPSTAFSHAATWDGWGVVNQSKLMRAAHRLVSGWPGNRSHVAADWVYDFKAEVQFKKGQLQGMSELPGCDGEVTRLKLLRQNFFLDPLDKETRAELAQTYRRNNYFAQATYYQNPETNLAIASVKKRLDSRQFQLEVSRERLDEMKALKDSADLDVTAASNLILLSAQRGKVDIYRFLTEDWKPQVMTEKLMSTALAIARKFERWELVQYIQNRTR
ncbi:MAG: S8/S53 family peptidase [Bdellovibrionales bacterium]|nr:S8/S53 family peptidase [Bdellovibrionales bacterium]